MKLLTLRGALLAAALAAASPLSAAVVRPAPSAVASVSAPFMAPEARSVSLEIRARALELPSAAALEDFAVFDGVGLSVMPFAGKALMGLDADNLAQYSPGDNRVHVNWDYVGADRRALEEAGLGPGEARTLTALAALPVYSHELRHAELRRAYGSDFPGLAEEEILTHLTQAEVMDEVLGVAGFAARRALLDRLFLVPHSVRLAGLRAQGFGSLADFVLRRYRGVSPTLDDPSRNAAAARATLDVLSSDPANAPRGFLEKARANLAFWESPAEVKRLTAFLQERINAAYAALGR